MRVRCSWRVRGKPGSDLPNCVGRRFVAKVDLVKDHKELYDKTMSSSRARQGRIASEKDLPEDANSLSRLARHGLSPKGQAIARSGQVDPNQARP